MKKLALSVLASAVVAAAFGPTALRADEGAFKPLAVLALASHDGRVEDSAEIGKIAERLGLPTWLDSLTKLYAAGDVAGIDASRPWGAVIGLGTDGLGAYGFVPVSDIDTLKWELDSYIAKVEEVSYGVYRVVATEGGKELYAKVTDDGWLFVSHRAATLRDAVGDPRTIVSGLAKAYDVAVRLELRNVPAEHGRKIVARLKEMARDKFNVDRVMPRDRLRALLTAAFHLDEVTLGWGRHAE